MHAHLRKIIVYSLSLIVLALFASPAFAQTATPAAIPTTISPTSPIYTDMLAYNMFHTFSCLAVGQSVIGQPCLNYVKGAPVLSQTNLSGGALGAVTGLIGGLYQNPPVRTYESLASLGETLGIVKEAKAQVIGSGAGVLKPIQTLWQVSRNISYVIMIIIFVIIGLMVMFRQKINPQTVITAQAAIPGLVIGLILITFSYFLAGLISDTAFIGTNLVGAYFSAVKGKPDQPQNLVQDISGESVLSIFTDFTKAADVQHLSSGVEAVLNAIDKAGGWLSTVVHGAILFLAYQYGSQVGPILAVPVGTPICVGAAAVTFGTAFAPCITITNLIGQLGGGAIAVGTAMASPATAVSLGLSIIMIAILIFTMLKLAFRLVNNYLSIIFLVVTAPFQFLFAALPGRQGIATNWILNLLSNVLAFPAIIAVFYFVAFLLNEDFGPFTISQTNQSDLVRSANAQEKIEIVKDTTFPLLGGVNLDFIRLLLAFGALMATPAIPDILARSIGKVSQAGQLIGQEISGAYRSGQRYAGQAGQAPQQMGRDLQGIGSMPNQTILETDKEGKVIATRVQLGNLGKITTSIPKVTSGGAPKGI